MFPSNSSHIGINDLISHSDQALFYQHFESNPTSKQETHPPLSFFHSLSPFEDNEIFLDQDHHHDFLIHLAEPEPQVPMMEVSSTKNKAPRRRSTNSKRDRHSKIKTARGLRDRRMRLSLEVAKRFFGLQDMLGFDKASKTVEWLLNQAKVEIKQLEKEKMKKKNHQSCSSSSTSECEGVSSLDEVVVSGNKEQGESEQKLANRRRTNRKRKSAVFTPLSRECREKARERARERTKEKMRNRTTTNREMGQLGSWNPYETGEECGNSLNPSLDVLNEGNKETSSQAKKHLRTVEDMVHHDSFPTISKWGQSMVFNSLTSLQERQFAEFHPSLGKSWETYNNNGI